jgi:hypothetical protein
MLVKTSEPDRVLFALDAAVRRRILDLAFDGKLTITDKNITLIVQTKDPTASEIVDTVRRIVSVASALERSRPRSV